MLWTAFSIGLVGSMHCIGMCGPIALALPYQQGNWAHRTGQVLLYNLGRIFMYAILGSTIGLLGRGIFLAGAQTYFSIALGGLLLLAALFSIQVETQLLRLPLLRKLQQWVSRQLGGLMHTQTSGALLTIGMLNGLLPCGLVYLAIAGAVASGSPLQGAAYMALFGLGTVPLMLATALAGQFIKPSWRSHLRRAVPLMLFGFGLFFIARGLQFHIPADFRFWENWENMPMCH